jgi:hypothetical protein
MYTKKTFERRTCKECKKSFIPWNTPQSFCGNPCRGKKTLTIEEANSSWVKKKIEDNGKRYRLRKDNFLNANTRVI